MKNLRSDIAAKRRKKHKNKIVGLVNSIFYNEQKSKSRLFTKPSSFALPKFVNIIIKNFFYPRSDIRFLFYFFSFVFILAPSLAGAAQVSLAWARSTGSNVAGYKMHYGNYSGSYQYTVDVGNSASCTISGLSEGTTYYFAATAYDTQQNESSYSNEVSFNSSLKFADVPPGYWAEDAIHTIYDAGISTGCSQNPLLYCPTRDVSRDQMAVFLERGINGGNYTPPPATGIFADVPVDFWAADWIEGLYSDGMTTGCSQNPLRYCPDRAVNRASMAVFLLKSKYGSRYTPPPATGIFSDVPVTHWAAKWIEQLYKEGITTGCQASPLQYCPDNPVTRAAMAVFLSRTFGF